MSLERQTHVSVFLSPKVDIIMEDITDEINDLQQSINATNGEDEGAPRRPVDLECRVTDSMQVRFGGCGDHEMFTVEHTGWPMWSRTIFFYLRRQLAGLYVLS